MTYPIIWSTCVIFPTIVLVENEILLETIEILIDHRQKELITVVFLRDEEVKGHIFIGVYVFIIIYYHITAIVIRGYTAANVDRVRIMVIVDQHDMIPFIFFLIILWAGCATSKE